MTVLKIALNLLNQYEINTKYVNLSLQSRLADGLNASERAQLTALVYTTVERKLTYDYYIAYLAERGIDEIDVETKNVLRLGLCQLLDMTSIPDFAAVNGTVSLVKSKGARGFVNGVLRRAARERDTLPLPPRDKKPLRYLSVAHSMPLPLVKRFYNIFGSDTEAFICGVNEKHHLTVAVNTLKISREDYVKLLEKEGITAELSEFSSISLRLDKSYNPKNLPGFSDGLFFVQDEACTAAVEALSPINDGVLVDTCAAPGGKSFAASILSCGKVSVHSFDISEAKLPLITDGAKRLSLNINADICDAKSPREELIGTADYVICDAPCSGLGVLSKKPDLRYKELSGIASLPALQYDILLASSSYLKSGGAMIYSTCTLLPEENEEVVARFISENEEFYLEDFKVGKLNSCKGMFTFLPHKHKTDGFFVTKIRRK